LAQQAAVVLAEPGEWLAAEADPVLGPAVELGAVELVVDPSGAAELEAFCLV
jgi:hypothetical protein